MPFTAAFTASQSVDGSTGTIVDTSNYNVEAKSTFTARTLTIYKSNGETLDANGNVTDTPTPINFSFTTYPSDSITIPVNGDYDLRVVLQLTSVSPQSGSIYVYERTVLLAFNINSFIYGLGSSLTAKPSRINDNGFIDNLSKLQTLADCAFGADKYGDTNYAQAMLDLGENIYKDKVDNF